MTEFKNLCFFCSDPILERKSQEHIISNSLLGRLGLKEQWLNGCESTTYSRIKVPSHPKCNNGFGSQFEENIIKLLEDPEDAYNQVRLAGKTIPLIIYPEESTTALITTWLSKIYYGLFYHDALKTKNDEWRSVCNSIINAENFKLTRKSYKEGHGFQLPSSLFAFKTPYESPDLLTMAYPPVIMFKIKNISFILCLGDGYLTQNYVTEEVLAQIDGHLHDKSINAPGAMLHRLAYIEMVAVRSSIPKQPSFVFSDEFIVNMSLTTLAANPDKCFAINTDEIDKNRLHLYEKFNLSQGG